VTSWTYHQEGDILDIVQCTQYTQHSHQL